MKTLYIFTILLFLLYIAGSCNDDQQKLFSGSTTMHFALSDNELDSIACSFLNTSESYITVNLPVELNGYAGQNYRFRLKADSSQTTAIVNKHYQPLEEFYEIKSTSIAIPIHSCAVSLSRLYGIRRSKLLSSLSAYSILHFHFS